MSATVVCISVIARYVEQESRGMSGSATLSTSSVLFEGSSVQRAHG